MRNNQRYLANAFVWLDGKSENKTDVRLLNLSEYGVSIHSNKFMDIEPNSVHFITVIPDDDLDIKEFQLKIEFKWLKMNKTHMEAGFLIIESFENIEFRKYLEHLAEKYKLSANSNLMGLPHNVCLSPNGRCVKKKHIV